MSTRTITDTVTSVVLRGGGGGGGGGGVFGGCGGHLNASGHIDGAQMRKNILGHGQAGAVSKFGQDRHCVFRIADHAMRGVKHIRHARDMLFGFAFVAKLRVGDGDQIMDEINRFDPGFLDPDHMPAIMQPGVPDIQIILPVGRRGGQHPVRISRRE